MPPTTPAARATRAAHAAALCAAYSTMIRLCSQSYNAAYSELVHLRQPLLQSNVERMCSLRREMEVDIAIMRADDWAMKTVLLEEIEVREAEERGG